MTMPFRELTRVDWYGLIIRVVLLIVGMVTGAIVLTQLWELPGFLLWIALSVLGVAWLIRWHTRNFGYLCPNCGHTFAITAWTNATSMNMGTRKSLRCPSCGKHLFCKGMVREAPDGDS